MLIEDLTVAKGILFSRAILDVIRRRHVEDLEKTTIRAGKPQSLILWGKQASDGPEGTLMQTLTARLGIGQLPERFFQYLRLNIPEPVNLEGVAHFPMHYYMELSVKVPEFQGEEYEGQAGQIGMKEWFRWKVNEIVLCGSHAVLYTDGHEGMCGAWNQARRWEIRGCVEKPEHKVIVQSRRGMHRVPSKAAVGAKTSFEEVPAGCHERQEVGSTIQGALGSSKRRTYRMLWEALVRRGTYRVPWEARGRKVHTGCPGRQQEEDVKGALGGTRSKSTQIILLLLPLYARDSKVISRKSR
ncbi:hypothetical protein BGX38DRAFT_1147665 [Terfezia claveryi]|nr:hypothetical protein BGX38DRAFT_1147665 [Terfezia claveryi]